MSRRPVVAPEAVRRTRRDPRFLLAVKSRIAEPGWRGRGRCLEFDPEVFFPTTNDEPDPAIAICRTCSVAGPCLAAALDSGEVDGVWGATTPDERRAMRLAWTDQPTKSAVRALPPVVARASAPVAQRTAEPVASAR